MSEARREWQRQMAEAAQEIDRTLADGRRHAQAMISGAVFRDAAALATVDAAAVLSAASQLALCVRRMAELQAERDRLAQARPA